MPETIDPGQQALDAEMAEIRQELGDDFVRFSADSKERHTIMDLPGISDIQSTDEHNELDVFRELIEGKLNEAFFNPGILRKITRERIRSLEVEGLVLDGISQEHPNGGIYIGNLVPGFLDIDFNLGMAESDKIDKLRAIRVTSVLRGVTGLVTRPPIDKIPDDLEGLPRFPVHSLCAAIYKYGRWSETHVFPDGRWIVEGFDNTAFQYGQAAFEGVTASDGIDQSGVDVDMEVSTSEGKIHIFRPEENALRLIRSCRHFAMPPISVSQFVEAVRQAVLNNRGFLPKNGKLYVRAFVVGLGGGTGANRAKQYLFAVEVSPHGNYFGSEDGEHAETLPGIKVKAITHDRPVSVRYKVAVNYAPIFVLKAEAKQAGYDDIMLVGSDGHILENGTSNTFFVRCNSSDDFTLFTPSLAENILPGITRKSLIELLRDPNVQSMLGCKVTVIDDKCIKETDIDISGFDGAFTTGTAAAISNIGSIDFYTEGTKQEQIEFNHPPTQAFIKKLYDLLMLARSGKLPGYEHWAMEV